ncbi:MAG: undecaprenyl diphosphate synthase family protein [Eubacteriales bacterium]|nr:undecaprenyl diphosphate synthase family protein [Eubacteriales bacterium]MDD4566067.1 undecaprenyl diphosphate synthase family protein [Eubacteriales bacterium]
MRIPSHIGVIPDGNRRWAKDKGFNKEDGYQYGLKPGLELLKKARDYGVKEITYYGFTVDNCKRPSIQQNAFKKACIDAVDLISSEGTSLLVIGNTESGNFPKELLDYTKRKDINGGGIKVNFLVNYGWEWDIGNIANCSSLKKSIYDRINSKDISRIDLIVRWGNMRRLSGFLPVQSVYADFYVVEEMWPDFSGVHLEEAFNWYNRQDVTLGG